MRAVLRTLSQCHAHRILHRDIKPGNFMLLNDSDRAPLKAIGEPLSCSTQTSLVLSKLWRRQKSAAQTQDLCACRFWLGSVLRAIQFAPYRSRARRHPLVSLLLLFACCVYGTMMCSIRQVSWSGCTVEIHAAQLTVMLCLMTYMQS